MHRPWAIHHTPLEVHHCVTSGRRGGEKRHFFDRCQCKVGQGRWRQKKRGKRRRRRGRVARFLLCGLPPLPVPCPPCLPCVTRSKRRRVQQDPKERMPALVVTGGGKPCELSHPPRRAAPPPTEKRRRCGERRSGSRRVCTRLPRRMAPTGPLGRRRHGRSARPTGKGGDGARARVASAFPTPRTPSSSCSAQLQWPDAYGDERAAHLVPCLHAALR